MGNIAERRGIMILGAGIMQVPLIRKARDMGLFVIASDKNAGAPGLKLAGHPLILDIKDIKCHVAFALANRERFNISGVVAGADCAVTAAFVSEALGLPGIPVDVAERSNNKWLMKQRWLRDNVATPWAEEVSSLTEARKALRKTSLPCMVKAIDNAASRGSRRIDFEHELEEALIDAKNHSTTKTALIEEYVEGREMYVGILGNERPEALPVIELDLSKLPEGIPRIAAAEVKWGKGTAAYRDTKSIVPTDLPEETVALLQKTAVAAYQALELRDYGRVDMRLQPDGRVSVIEVNPNPWLSSRAELAMAARKAGRTYTQLVGEIVDLAMARYS